MSSSDQLQNCADAKPQPPGAYGTTLMPFEEADDVQTVVYPSFVPPGKPPVRAVVRIRLY
jgi:hypothetical protein